jgi:hypothetical protein
VAKSLCHEAIETAILNNGKAIQKRGKEMNQPKRNRKTTTTKQGKRRHRRSNVEQRLGEVIASQGDVTKAQQRLEQYLRQIESMINLNYSKENEIEKRLARIERQMYKEPFWQPHRGKILWLGGVVATLGFNWVVFPQQVQAYWFNWVILSLVGWPLLLIWTVLRWLHLA